MKIAGVLPNLADLMQDVSEDPTDIASSGSRSAIEVIVDGVRN
jgi:hypothetical protein